MSGVSGMTGMSGTLAAADRDAPADAPAEPRQASEEPEEREALRVLEGLQTWLDGTRDLAGRFEQELLSGAISEGLAESGRVWVMRPGKLRFEYQKPESKLALVDGVKTWFWIEEDRQLTLGRLTRESELLPLLLAGTGQLGELFRPTLVVTSDAADDGNYRLQLDPRSEDDSLERVTVSIDPAQYAIRSAEVVDVLGNRMLYRFERLKRNRGVRPELFRFEPPPDAEIVGEH